MIPNIIHFIFGLAPDFGGKPFSLVHYLAVKSAYIVNQPESINLYYQYEPQGEWWEKTKRYINAVQIRRVEGVSSAKFHHFAHLADFIRLQILMEKGGIYLDMDVICIRSFTPLLKYSFVMGRQGIEGGIEKHVGLCNAVILSEANSFFGKKWLEGFDPQTSLWHGFRSRGWDEYWDELSVQYPNHLAKLFPEYICIQDDKKFFWPLFYPEHLKWLFSGQDGSFSHSYCHHLWESLSWETYLKNLSVDHIINVDTNFNRMVRPFL
jgi:hypothetical protein